MTIQNTSLRPIEPEDLDFLYTLENNPEMWNFGTPGAPYSRYALKQYIAAMPTEIFHSENLRLIIEDDTPKQVGIIDLLNYSATDRRAEVGIALIKEKRQQGHANRALHLIEQHARNILNIKYLYAKVSENNNHAAKKLFIHANYDIVATLPNWHYRQGEYENLLLFQKKL